MDKAGLLLIHGTVYGTIAEALPWRDMDNKSVSVCKLTSQVDWRNNLYPNAQPASCLQSPLLTDNAPIDVISWNLTGYTGESGLEWWQQCMSLFLRHI